MEYALTIKTLSPLCLSSGKADVNVDTDVVHDPYGLPYFPGKRLRGLLYESAAEVAEMAELCGENFITQKDVDELFHHREDSQVILVVPDIPLADYPEMRQEWAYLQENYPGLIRPESVLKTYTSIRFQTAIGEDGMAKDASLRNIRVLDKGLTFSGRISLEKADEKHLQVLALACCNLRRAGLNRNRGFGRIQCEIKGQKQLLEKILPSPEKSKPGKVMNREKGAR